MPLHNIEKTDVATLDFVLHEHLLRMAAEELGHEFARDLEADGGFQRDRKGTVPDVAEEFFYGVVVEALILLGLSQDTVRSGELHVLCIHLT